MSLEPGTLQSLTRKGFSGTAEDVLIPVGLTIKGLEQRLNDSGVLSSI